MYNKSQFQCWYETSRGRLDSPLTKSLPKYKFNPNDEVEVTVLVNKDGSKVVKKENSTLNGFTNFSTAKIAQSLLGEVDIKNTSTKWYDKTGCQHTYEYNNYADSFTSVLGGIHFNSYQELEDYFYELTRPYLKKLSELKASNAQQYEFNNVISTFECSNPFSNVRIDEYQFVNWQEIWELMGQGEEYGLTADIGLTGSNYEQMAKDNPDYAFQIANVKASIEKANPIELKNKRIQGYTSIIHSTIDKIKELRAKPVLYDQSIKENMANLKSLVKNLITVAKGIPKTGDCLVDTFLSRIKFA